MGGDLCSLVKEKPVLSKVLDDGVAETGVVLIVEDGEVFEEVGDDDVDEEDGDEDVVGYEPGRSHHYVPTVPVQLGAVVVANLYIPTIIGWRQRNFTRV